MQNSCKSFEFSHDFLIIASRVHSLSCTSEEIISEIMGLIGALNDADDDDSILSKTRERIVQILNDPTV